MLLIFTKDYSKHLANQSKARLKVVEVKITTLEKKLAMINLKADNAVQLIEIVNVKLDIWKKEYANFNRQRVQGQILRSKSHWTELAEKNTKYFFGLEKCKSKAKTMMKLEVEGAVITDPDLILHEQENFYRKLYTKDSKVRFNWVNNTDRKLNETQKILMDSEITVEEIAQAIKQMPSNKTPGPDGLSANFFKMFFGRFKLILLNAYQEAFSMGRLHFTARFGYLSLIPKGDKSRKFLKDWRLIALLNTEYKILSKVFANQLKMVIDDLINEDQCGFIKGRNITTNIRLMFDILEYTWAKQIPALAIMVDFEKAFDRVDYEVLYQILRFFGFSENFIKWIKVIFTDFNLSTVNNGSFSSSWIPTRGLHQGNPIAPILFLMLAETLAMQLRDNPKIEGIEINGLKYLLSQFADDLSIFTKFKQDLWQEIMNVFDDFESQTGMKISYEKTTIYRIGSIRNSNAKFFSARKVIWTSDPLKLLGIIISHVEKECFDLNFNPLMDKVKNVLEVWGIRNLSIIGKIEIVNTLVASLFVYKCSVLPCLSKEYLSSFKKLVLNFIWEGKKVKIPIKY